MVQDEPQLGQRLRGGDRRGQLAWPDQQVVGEPGGGDRPQPAADVASAQPVRLGLLLDQVPDTDQVGAAGFLPQLGQPLPDGRVGQVHPADDAGHQVRAGGQGEQFRRLCRHRDRLHDDGPADARGVRRYRQIGEAEVAPQRQHRGPGDPGLVPHGQVPHVVVSVDGAVSGHGAAPR